MKSVNAIENDYVAKQRPKNEGGGGIVQVKGRGILQEKGRG